MSTPGAPPRSYGAEDLSTTLEYWRRAWGLRSDGYSPVFEGYPGDTFVGIPRSFLAEVVAAVDRCVDGAAAIPIELKRHAAKLARLARSIIRGRGGIGPLKAGWRALPISVQREFELSVRYRRGVLPNAYETIADCVQRGSPFEVSWAIWRLCASGEGKHRRPSRSTGKRTRPSERRPVLAFRAASGRQANRHVDLLVMNLSLICLEALGQHRQLKKAHADLVERVFDIVGIPGAQERTSAFRAAVRRAPRRSESTESS